jgi:hypothetical protein
MGTLLRVLATLLLSMDTIALLALALASIVAAIFATARPELTVLLVVISVGAVLLTIPEIRRIWHN